MTIRHHELLAPTPGTTQALVSLHYGQPGRGPKVLVQASLHTDETPGMLVAHHLRQRLDALQAEGRVRGEVVLLPAANPIGLHQWVAGQHHGRFELASGENFNRGYTDLTDTVVAAVQGRLGSDAEANLATVRAALREAVAALPVATTLDSLRRLLLGLACDADVVLDLHCDGEAALHLYTTPGCWPALQPLAGYLGARAVLLAERSGGDPFDEACSMLWPALAERLGPAQPLPTQPSLAVTVELRGQNDVTHRTAAADAQGVLHYLALRGVLDVPPAPVPPLQCAATPLAGSMPLVAPHGGVVVFLREPGDTVQAGEPLAELIDPITGQTTPLHAPTSGVFYARSNSRYTRAGGRLGKVAGAEVLRHGRLLSP
jgi:predicted deacylase